MNQASFDEVANPLDDCTIWHMVHAYAKPAAATMLCPRDGRTGCAYVDTLDGEHVGMATALLSYSWGYKVTDVADALSLWTANEDRDPKTTSIWICSLCLNQFRMTGTATP